MLLIQLFIHPLQVFLNLSLIEINLLFKVKLEFQRSVFSSIFSYLLTHSILLNALDEDLGDGWATRESDWARHPHGFQIHFKQLLVDIFVDLGDLLALLDDVSDLPTASYDWVLYFLLWLWSLFFVLFSLYFRGHSVHQFDTKTSWVILAFYWEAVTQIHRDLLRDFKVICVTKGLVVSLTFYMLVVILNFTFQLVFRN